MAKQKLTNFGTNNSNIKMTIGILANEDISNTVDIVVLNSFHLDKISVLKQKCYLWKFKYEVFGI